MNEAAPSFEDWVQRFDISDPSERELLAKSAQSLLLNSAFQFVFARLEAKLLRHLLTVDLEVNEVMKTKMMAVALRSLHSELIAMVEDLKLSKKQ